MGLAAEPKKLLSEKIVYCQAALYGRQIFARFYSAGCNQCKTKSLCGLGNISEEVASFLQIFHIVLFEFIVAIAIFHFTQVDALVATVYYQVNLRPMVCRAIIPGAYIGGCARYS